MPDMNQGPEAFRAMMTESLDRLRKANAEYFELIEKGLASSPLPVADQARQVCGFMQRSAAATFDFGNRLLQAKDMQEALKLQSEFFQQQMQTLTEQTRSVGESALKAATGAFMPKS